MTLHDLQRCTVELTAGCQCPAGSIKISSSIPREVRSGPGAAVDEWQTGPVEQVLQDWGVWCVGVKTSVWTSAAAWFKLKGGVTSCFPSSPPPPPLCEVTADCWPSHWSVPSLSSLLFLSNFTFTCLNICSQSSDCFYLTFASMVDVQLLAVWRDNTLHCIIITCLGYPEVSVGSWWKCDAVPGVHTMLVQGGLAPRVVELVINPQSYIKHNLLSSLTDFHPVSPPLGFRS